MKQLRVFGHPLHPATVHFPLAAIALAPAGDLFDGLGYYALVAGVALSLPAAVTGFLDYIALPDGPALRTGTWHLLVMLTAVGLAGGAIALRPGGGPPGAWAWGLEISAAVLVLAGGWLGGELVYRHGAGRVDGPGPSKGERS
jgi:uncharacterized membrane protein